MQQTTDTKQTKRRFISLTCITELFQTIFTSKGYTVSTLTRFHIGGGLRRKLAHSEDVSLPQFYTMLRLLMIQERTTRGKLMVMARMLDAMEHAFHDVYSDSTPPFPEGCVAAVRGVEWGVLH